MNNPLRILTELDKHLQHSLELNIYGRAAIALGFDPGPPFSATLDVDLIIPEVQLDSMDANEEFWMAVEIVNSEDRADIRLLATQETLDRPDWEKVFQEAVLPDISEIAEAFQLNRNWFFEEVIA